MQKALCGKIKKRKERRGKWLFGVQAQNHETII